MQKAGREVLWEEEDGPDLMQTLCPHVLHLEFPASQNLIQLHYQTLPLRYIIHFANDNPRNLNRSSAAGGVSGGFKVGFSSKVSRVMARGIGELLNKRAVRSDDRKFKTNNGHR